MSGYQEWRLLLIDDDEDDHILTRSMLGQLQGRKVKLDWASGYEKGRRFLCSNTYDAVLVDYDLGPRTGIELIREFVTQEYPAPLILYTGRGSYEVDVEAMQAGATLYLTKGETSPLLMERSIRYAIERKQIEDELRASNERLVDYTNRLAANAEQLANELAERKRVEEMLETAHAEVLTEKNRLLAVMEALPVGVAILDVQGGSLHTNSYYDQIWGSPRPVVHNIDDYVPYKAWWVDSGQPVQPEEWASALAVQKGETIIGQLLQIERFDGTRRFILNSGAPILDARGQIAGSAVAIMDITEQKQAEEELRRQREWLSVTLNSIGDGVIAADAEGRVTFLNPVAVALTGWSQEEALGLPVQQVFQIINEKTRRAAEDIVSRALKEKSAVALANHTALINKQGVEIPIEDSTAPILDAQGETIGVVLVFHDVTEKRRAQVALQSYAEQLKRSN